MKLLRSQQLRSHGASEVADFEENKDYQRINLCARVVDDYADTLISNVEIKHPRCKEKFYKTLLAVHKLPREKSGLKSHDIIPLRCGAR